MNIERIYKPIGENITKARLKAGLTQQELAIQLKSPFGSMSRTTLAHLELGHTRAYLHHLYRIAEVLKINVTELLPGSEGQKRK